MGLKRRLSLANIAENFTEAFAFLNEGRQKGSGVLVHCFGGLSLRQTPESFPSSLEIIRG